jgi:hypothetical protein
VPRSCEIELVHQAGHAGKRRSNTSRLILYTVPLGRCDVDWHGDRGIVALACVGRDMIKVWPLPVETPWWEDEIKRTDQPWGQRAGRVGSLT